MTGGTAKTKRGKTPRYAEIADILRAEIMAGTPPVGSFLPTEAVLCRRFSVSRFTVREALRGLQGEGMLSRVQGAGSRVLRDAPTDVFVHNYQSISDLTQYAEETTLEVMDVSQILLDAQLAARIGGRDGETWTRLRALRRTAQNAPLAFVESYVPQRFSKGIEDLAQASGPMYASLAETAGEVIQDVVQETQALPASPDLARLLGLDPGAPALCILRRYATASGTLIASFNWHPGGDRYIHRTLIGLGSR